jgi:WD40 repeat protein
MREKRKLKALYMRGVVPIKKLSILALILAVATSACSAGPHNDSAERQEVMMLSHPDSVSFLAWSPDGKKLAVSYANDTRITLWDLASKKRLWTISKKLGAEPEGRDLDFGPGGETVITGSAITYGGENVDATISIISVETGEISQTLRYTKPSEGQNRPLCFVISRDRSKLLAPAGRGRVITYDTSSWKVIDEIGPIIHRNVMFGGKDLPADIIRLAWDETHNLLFISLFHGQVQTWGLATHRKIMDFQPAQVDLLDMRLNPKNSELVIGASANLAGMVPPQGGPMINLRDNPATLVQAWIGQNGKQIRVYAGPGGSANAIDVSSDGRLVAAVKSRMVASGTPAYFLLWDTESGALLKQIDLGRGFVGDLAFSPDSKRLAYSIDNSVHVIDLDH